MKKVLIIAMLLINASAFSQKSGISFEKSSWNQILAKAKAENKLIFMDAFTSWCGPCKSMSAQVFPNAKVGEFFNSNFINAKIDMEEGEGPALAAKYPVRGYPTLLFINPNTGKIVNQALGYRNAEQLLELGEQTQANKKKTSI